MIVVMERHCSYSKTVLKCHSTNLACFFILEYNLHLVVFFANGKGRPSRAPGWPEFDPDFFSLCISYLIIKDTHRFVTSFADQTRTSANQKTDQIQNNQTTFLLNY